VTAGAGMVNNFIQAKGIRLKLEAAKYFELVGLGICHLFSTT
jgi:hypothetical protein